MEDEKLLTDYLKEKGNSKSSITSYVYFTHQFIKWTESRHLATQFISYSQLLDYVAHLRKRNLSQRTVQGHVIAITHYFEALIKEKLINENPARYLEIKTKQVRKLYPTLSKEQLENLHKGFDITATRNTRPTGKASAIRHKIATGLMVFQGLEVTTLSKLTTQDVDVLGGTIKIQRGRTYNERTLALQATQIIELDRYINQTRRELQSHFNKQESDLLLITGYKNYRDAHKQLIRKLKKQEPTLQDTQQIRASVITHWLKQHNLREVQYMAGHRKILSTEAYLRNDTEGLQIDIDRFHPMNDNNNE